MTIIPQSLNYYADGLRRYAGSVTWGPLVQLSRSAILSTLSKITVGQLKVIEADGHTTICGELGANISGPQTELRIHKETFWVRMMLFADMVNTAVSLPAIRPDTKTNLFFRASQNPTC